MAGTGISWDDLPVQLGEPCCGLGQVREGHRAGPQHIPWLAAVPGGEGDGDIAIPRGMSTPTEHFKNVPGDWPLPRALVLASLFASPQHTHQHPLT